MSRCRAHTKSGTRCRRHALQGEYLCAAHASRAKPRPAPIPTAKDLARFRGAIASGSRALLWISDRERFALMRPTDATEHLQAARELCILADILEKYALPAGGDPEGGPPS
jgi:hypothetical protein